MRGIGKHFGGQNPDGERKVEDGNRTVEVFTVHSDGVDILEVVFDLITFSFPKCLAVK